MVDLNGKFQCSIGQIVTQRIQFKSFHNIFRLGRHFEEGLTGLSTRNLVEIRTFQQRISLLLLSELSVSTDLGVNNPTKMAELELPLTSRDNI